MTSKRHRIVHQSVAEIIDHCLRGSNDIHVVVGPFCWQPNASGGKDWYVIVATSGAEDGFRHDQIVVPDGDPSYRAAVLRELCQRRPLVIHDCDDELYMARLCETLWPSERITDLRKAIERERGLV